MDSFAGKLAVVTGGGSGMGRELVVKLAAEGCAVATCDLRQAAAEETAALARAGAPDGTTVTAHACDVADEAQVARFRDEALAAHGASQHGPANTGPATSTSCSATPGSWMDAPSRNLNLSSRAQPRDLRLPAARRSQPPADRTPQSPLFTPWQRVT